MRARKRKLQIDVCDYEDKVVCPIYNNSADVAGQATNVHIINERNGWKQVTFSLPTKCVTDAGEEDNFRLAYIVPDYKLRTIKDGKTDWFIITQDGVKHEAFSKNVTVTAGHVSQRLKNRSLDLEFSDSEGNNVGTIKQLTDTVLENTHWKTGKVAKLLEDDGVTEKIRSLNASAKTGAFRLIEQICEKFEAKPVYNGDRTVDLYPMNPFSELEPGEIPDAVYPNAAEDERFLVDSNVIELHYDKAIKTMERNRNAENISTRLYGYGSYGDYVNKYCSIQTAEHDEYVYNIEESANGEFEVTDKDGVKRYFKANLSAGTTLIWSMLDYNSRRYVWDTEKRYAYKVYEVYETPDYIPLSAEPVSVTNYFPFLSDYTYYEKVGLLTDEMFQKVAAYQRDMVDYYKASIEAQNILNDNYERLSDVGVPKSGFLKLDIEKCVPSEEGSTLTIRWSDEYPDGVIYRSDYAEAEKNYFEWFVAQSLKANGDPVSGPASVIYILHNTSPIIAWDCVYLKDIDSRTYTDVNGKTIHDGYNYATSKGDKPKVIQVWGNVNVEEGDEVYLFCRNSLSGKLGAKLSMDEAALETLEGKTTLDNEKHPVTFIDWDDPLPEINVQSHGWVYRYKSDDYDTPGVLYFCWATRNDTEWHNVYIQDAIPEPDENAYFFHTKYCTLWHCESGEWIKFETVEEQTVAREFSIVYTYCRQRDEVYKGKYEEYAYTLTEDLPANTNCAIYTNFGFYYLFSTDMNIEAGGTLKLNTLEGRVYQDDNVEHILTPHSYLYSTLIYAEENNLSDATFFEGSIYITGENRLGTDAQSEHSYRSNYISVWPNDTYTYNLPENSIVALYDANRMYLGFVQIDLSEGEFSTAVNETYSQYVDPKGRGDYRQTRYIRLVLPKNVEIDEIKTTYQISLKDRLEYCFCNDKKYKILNPIESVGDEPVGINTLIRKFKDLARTVYEENIPAVQAAQKVITDANAEQLEVLGDILREGWWQDGSYVEGDEARLYNDTLTNLRKIAQPEIDYTFSYLSLRGANTEPEYSADELNEVDWPVIEITDAAHLVDPELKVNQWAYIEKVDECFDMPWTSTLDINTKLTLAGQHEFKDVLSRIAEVASETKAKQTLYQRAEAISSTGTISAGNLEGEIDTEITQVVGGSTGWKTDVKGNMVMESANGLSAIMFNGSGLFISNSKNTDGDWVWNQLGTGHGIDADSITTGEINGRLVKTGSIRADKLMANVGNELDIGSNKALNLFATIDGLKPTGSLKTSDALIEIKAGTAADAPEWTPYTIYEEGQSVYYFEHYWLCVRRHKSDGTFNTYHWKQYSGTTPAVINIGAGGEINLLAKGDEDDKQPPKINIASGGKINMKANSDINIEAGSRINIASGGTLTVSSNNFKVKEDGNVELTGKITSQAGQIANWHIGEDYLGNADTLNESTIGLRGTPGSNNDNIVIWAGNKNRENAPFKVRANGTVAISGDSSFVIYDEREIDGETVNVENIIIDNSGIKLGRKGETTEDVAEREFNFAVDSRGNATATGIHIVQGDFSGGAVTSASLRSSSLRDSSIMNSSLTNTEINGGEIHIGNLDEHENRIEKFGVTSSGYTTIKSGQIMLGEILDENEAPTGHYKLNIDDNGSVIINQGSIQINSGTITASGENVGTSVANGALTAIGATITGTIQKGSNIGDFSITANYGEFHGTAGTVYLNPTANGTYALWCGNASTTNAPFSVTKTGNVKTANLTVSGTYSNPSSKEYKENIQPIKHRDAFDQLNPVSFHYKGQDQTRYGLIYEELISLYPELCHETDGIKGISYIDFIPILIKEIQELRTRISELERK